MLGNVVKVILAVLIVCSFLSGCGLWLRNRSKPEFKYRKIHVHTHEGWGEDYDFQNDTHGTHSHRHDGSDVILTHGHWILDTPDTDPKLVLGKPSTHIHEGWSELEGDAYIEHSHLSTDGSERKLTHRHHNLYMRAGHTHAQSRIKSKSENWRRAPNGDWVHDHFYKYIPETRTLLYMTHSHP